MPEKKQKGIKNLRTLNMDEKGIWETATKDVTPIKSLTIFNDKISSEPKVLVNKKIVNPRVSEITPTVNLKPILNVKDDKSSRQMSAAQNKKFKRGELTIDASIDLHGMTIEIAHNKLINFIKINYTQGMRCLLVITGKGARDDMGHGQGVLRRNLPLWLECPNISPLILAINTAAPKHGGSGAFYIYLRKN